MSEAIKHVSDTTFDHDVLQSENPVLVDFWAEWCGPCRMLSPAIDQVAQRYAGKVKVGKLNIDNNEQLTARYGINAIPRVLLFVPGEPPRQIQVFPQNIEASVSSISEAIDSALAKG
jgi:thioredoxin 1